MDVDGENDHSRKSDTRVVRLPLQSLFASPRLTRKILRRTFIAKLSRGLDPIFNKQWFCHGTGYIAAGTSSSSSSGTQRSESEI